MKGKFIMATKNTPKPVVLNGFKSQAKIISITKKLLAQSLNIENKKIDVSQDFKQHTLVINVDANLDSEQLEKVEAAKTFIMLMLS